MNVIRWSPVVEVVEVVAVAVVVVLIVATVIMWHTSMQYIIHIILRFKRQYFYTFKTFYTTRRRFEGIIIAYSGTEGNLAVLVGIARLG
jgi:hypothetical protein